MDNSDDGDKRGWKERQSAPRISGVHRLCAFQSFVASCPWSLRTVTVDL